MLNLIPHSSLPLLFYICLEPDLIWITQFIGLRKRNCYFRQLFQESWNNEIVTVLFLTLIEGVHAIHLSGYIHNDVKPNNTMVEVRGLRLIIGFKRTCPLHKGKFYRLSQTEKAKICRKVSSFATWTGSWWFTTKWINWYLFTSNVNISLVQEYLFTSNMLRTFVLALNNSYRKEKILKIA